MSRRRRPGEVNCNCGAYSFVHRQMGGRCNGGAYVESHFTDHMHNGCRDCHFFERTDEGLECQVLQGLDTLLQCPALTAHIRFHGIKLYGVNR